MNKNGSAYLEHILQQSVELIIKHRPSRRGGNIAPAIPATPLVTASLLSRTCIFSAGTPPDALFGIVVLLLKVVLYD